MALKLPKLRVPKLLKSVKYCLAGVNSVFLLTGILLLAAGVTVLIINSQYDVLVTQRFFNIPGFVIATGVIILLSSVIGFYAAISEHFFVIVVYVLLHLVVLVFEISIIISAFALQNDAPSIVRPPMMASLQLYSTRLDIARIWDDLQMEFECCGVVGRFDYISNQIPVSCCHMDYGTISPFECLTGNAYPTGCADALGEWLSYNANVLGICAIVTTCIEVILISISSWLAWRSKFEKVELES